MKTIDRDAYKLFVAALDLDDVERAAFLAQSCSHDDSLREAVDKLLGALRSSAAFLESPAVSSFGLAKSVARPERHFAPDAVEGLRIIRCLGAGGMAEVYEAEQQSPQRRVAVKILHGQLTDTSALQRFHFEADALARLNHPNIAKIFRMGTCRDTAGNQVPYFAMEYIPDATTIVKYAVDQKLSISERLLLFAEVADAVQSGHQTGIIHRDLKPGNILVDTNGRPRIIDFGVAKAASPEIDDATISHEHGNIVGTLNYMSPEQCAGHNDIDTRADVYSLGVVLYELLTESRPYDLSSSSIVDAVRTVQVQRPRLPSEQSCDVPKELNAIVLKALEKEPEQRYRTASEFAEDIRRFLEDRPILARAPSMWYYGRKFAKRNPALVAALLGVVIALTCGISATSWMAYLAAQARDEAVENAEDLAQVVRFQQSQLGGVDVAAMGAQIRKELLEEVRKQLSLSRESPPREHDEGDLSHEQFEQLIHRANFTTLMLDTYEDNMLNQSLQSIRGQFVDRPSLRARLLQSVAVTYYEFGRPRQAEPILQEVLQIRQLQLGDSHPDTLDTKYHLASVLTSLNRLEESQKLYRDVHDGCRESLGGEHRETLLAANGLAGTFRKMGDLDQAVEIWQQTWETQRRVLGKANPDTLATLNNLGVVLSEQGQFQQAEGVYRDVVEGYRQHYGDRHPKYHNALSNLGLLLYSQGKLDEAKPLLEESLASLRHRYGDAHRSTLLTMGSLAMLRLQLNDLEGARPLFTEDYENRRRALGETHADTLRALASLATFQRHAGEHSLAESNIHEVIETQRRVLGEDHPDLTISSSMLASWLHEDQRYVEAEAIYVDAIRRVEESHGRQSPLFGEVVGAYGAMLLDAGRPDEAREKLQMAYDLLIDTFGPDATSTRRAARKLASLKGNAPPDGRDDAESHDAEP